MPSFPTLKTATGIAAFALGMGFVPSALQAEPEPPQPELRVARVPSAASAASADGALRRLIIRYKDDTAATTTDSLGTTPTGRERATALNTRQYRHPGDGVPLELRYLKSITTQSHVMVSSAPLNRTEMQTLLRDIARDPRIEHAEIDERAYPLFVPNDPSYATQQWSLKSPAAAAGGANLPNAWGKLVGGVPVNGAGVTVAVVDTGYRAHADLNTNILPGYDFVSTDPDTSLGGFSIANDGDGRDADATDPGDWNTTPNYFNQPCDVADSSWHGTRVAGIVAALGNNSTGIIGVAYGAKILPVRALGRCGGYVSDIAAGIRWAAGVSVPGVPNNTAHIAKVINLSLGGSTSCLPTPPSTTPTTYQSAVTAAVAAGSVVVVATGNESNSTLNAPANCTGVIAVTAHTRLGDKASYANVGAGTNISAPGGGYGARVSGDGSSIYSTSNTGTTTALADNYARGNGTSFAAPHVAGVAALLLQIKPTLTPTAILNYLTSTARAYPTGTDCAARTDCGAGMLDATAAVQALLTAQGMPNTPPVMAALAGQTVTAAGSLQFTATATDVDGDTVTYVATGLPSGARFDGETGVFSWGYALPGVYTVVITPSDGSVSGTSRSVGINVTGTLPSGGGGAFGGLDLLTGLLVAGAAWRLRRPLAAG